MKALLLAAGRGTRLGSLSRATPKCLQEIGAVTVLDRLIAQLAAAGVDEYLINTHHLADQVRTHVSESAWGSRARLVYEPTLLGTLGTLRANLDFFSGGPGWVLHADNVIEGGLRSLGRAFETRPSAAWGTMLAFTVRNPSDFGVVTLDDGGLMSGFFEKVDHPPSDLASAATFVFGAEALDVVRQLPDEYTDISRDLLPVLVGRIAVVAHGGRILDIGTPANLSAAQLLDD